MQPFDLGFQPGDRVLVLLESIGDLPRTLRARVTAVNPMGMILLPSPGQMPSPVAHDDEVTPPLFLSWNTVRAVWLIVRAAPVMPSPAEPSPFVMPSPAEATKEAEEFLSGQRHPGVRQGQVSNPSQSIRRGVITAPVDWVPAGEMPGVMHVQIPPEVEADLASLGENEAVTSEFRKALVAELNDLRKSGRLYG